MVYLAFAALPIASGQWQNNYVIASTVDVSSCYLSGVTFGSCTTYGSAICQDSGGIMVSNNVYTNGCLSDLGAQTDVDWQQTGLAATATLYQLTTGFYALSRHIQDCNGMEWWEDYLPGSFFPC